MQALMTIDPFAARVLFGVLRDVLWADRQVEQRELDALGAAAMALGLEEMSVAAWVGLGPAGVSMNRVMRLDARSRFLVYVSAVWMASIDGRFAERERALISELRTALDVSDEVARFSRAHVRWVGSLELGSLRAEFERLVVDGAKRFDQLRRAFEARTTRPATAPMLAA